MLGYTMQCNTQQSQFGFCMITGPIKQLVFTLPDFEAMIEGMKQGIKYNDQGLVASPGDPIITRRDLMRATIDPSGMTNHFFEPKDIRYYYNCFCIYYFIAVVDVVAFVVVAVQVVVVVVVEVVIV